MARVARAAVKLKMASSLDASSAASLDALLVLLEKATCTSQDAAKLSTHELTAVVSLLRPLLTCALDADRHQHAQALLLAASRSLEHDAVAAAPALSCVQLLLTARGRLSPTARELFWWVLELTRHSDPKVRSLAQRTCARVIEARPPLSGLAARFSEVPLPPARRAPRCAQTSVQRVCRCTPPPPSPPSCCSSSSRQHLVHARPPRRTPRYAG